MKKKILMGIILLVMILIVLSYNMIQSPEEIIATEFLQELYSVPDYYYYQEFLDQGVKLPTPDAPMMSHSTEEEIEEYIKLTTARYEKYCTPKCLSEILSNRLVLRMEERAYKGNYTCKVAGIKLTNCRIDSKDKTQFNYEVSVKEAYKEGDIINNVSYSGSIVIENRTRQIDYVKVFN